MMHIQEYIEQIKKIYGNSDDEIDKQLCRYNKLHHFYKEHFTNPEIYFFSVPGRTEICGNHTDHNLGRVIAASISLDSIAIASRNNTNKINLYSEGYDKPFIVSLDELNKNKSEEGTTNSLITGIAFRFKELGYDIGGFDAVMSSDVLPGSGLSSSASVEVLIGSIFNYLFNDGLIIEEEIAKIGQYSENVFFGKPCGLMDQMACAVGSFIAIDFIDIEKPKVEKIEYDFASQKYKLLIVDSGGNHADLTDEYASIPNEMKLVSKELDKKTCRDLDFDTLYSNLTHIRAKIGDRAFLRAFHFIEENKRVTKIIESLKKDDFKEFLVQIKESGNSSFKWLQNIFSVNNVKEQGTTLALALSEKYIAETGEGACRIHGGGFAGTIQVFLPSTEIDNYVKFMEKVFGDYSVKVLDIRPYGAVCLNKF